MNGKNRSGVIIHPRPDLDACACVALAGVMAQDVHFVPAGETTLPHVCPCCGKQFAGDERILDHQLGEKGRLGEDGTRYSAAAIMPEASSADPELLAEVEEQDSTGRTLTPRFPLAAVLAAVRVEASERGLRDTELDREVVTAMSRIIRGLNILHKSRQDARELIARTRIEEIGGFKLAILPEGETPPSVGIVLNEEYGVAGAIFRTGFDLGIARYPGHTEPNLRKLIPFLPKWFIHSAGFLACWGSRKSRAKSLPPTGTPQTQEELLNLVRRVFGR